MKKIKVLVDVSGSADINAIEKQLIKIKLDNNSKYDIDVAFLSSGTKLEAKLESLNIPLSDSDKKMFGAGGDDFSQELQKIQAPYNAVIFIGDFLDSPIQKESISPDISYLFISTKKNQTLEKSFIQFISNEFNVRKTNVINYTSLDNYLFKNQNKYKVSTSNTNLKNSSDLKFEVQEKLVGEMWSNISGEFKPVVSSNIKNVREKNKSSKGSKLKK